MFPNSQDPPPYEYWYDVLGAKFGKFPHEVAALDSREFHMMLAAHTAIERETARRSK